MRQSVEIQKVGGMHYSLDVRGYVCPYPELLTLRALQSLSKGNVLEVLLDNPPSVKDITITLKKRGYTILELLRVGKGLWKLIVSISY